MVATAALRFARYLTPVLLASVLVISLPGEAGACSCVPADTAEVVAAADLVFVGEEVSRVDTRREWPPVAITFSVVEAYKGEVPTEITVWTGQGDGDCGLPRTRGAVGITVYTHEDGRLAVDSCGSLHDPAAIAALLDPIATMAAAPPAPGPEAAGGGVPWPLIALAAAGSLAVGVGLLLSRRRDDWQDGWSTKA